MRVFSHTLTQGSVSTNDANGDIVVWVVDFVVHRDDRAAGVSALENSFYPLHLTQDLWAIGGSHLNSQWERAGPVQTLGLVYV